MPKKIVLHHPKTNDHGFTLIEMMITLVVSAIIGLCAFASYSVQSKTFSTQREIAKIQQDLRGALYLMEFDVLNAGRDPGFNNLYGLEDIRYYGYLNGAINNQMLPSAFVMPAAPNLNNYFASYPVLEFSSVRSDTDGDGIGDTEMVIRYQVYDFNNDGRPDLGRRTRIDPTPNLSTPELVAEGVAAIGFAFAYNSSPNGRFQITRTIPVVGGDPLGNVIWAVDTDGDNLLDTNIDITGDGYITLDDDISGDGIIDSGDDATALLATPVNINNVVAVKIWLLLQSERQSPENLLDTKQYVVGNRIIPPPIANPNGFQDRFKRRVHTVTVALRNFRRS